MFKRLFGRWRGMTPRMPDVDPAANIEEIFEKARNATVEPPPAEPGRHVVIVTPGRMLMFQACPAPGSMPQEQVLAMERMISPSVRRNIAALAYTELSALNRDISRAIPFLGLLLGLAYIGHSVWIFEGHPSALAAGCRNAVVLIVDGDMVPHRQGDWTAVASSVMRHREIYVHDRASYSLRKVT